MLDGEICCLAPDVGTRFYDLMFCRDWPYFYAFDLLSVDGDDLTTRSLLQRKRRLRRIMPRVESRVLYLDHIAERGADLYRVACDHDCEGIVPKWTRGRYQTDDRCTSWLKIKTPQYTQIDGRHELFDRRKFEGARHRCAVVPQLVLL